MGSLSVRDGAAEGIWGVGRAEGSRGALGGFGGSSKAGGLSRAGGPRGAAKDGGPQRDLGGSAKLGVPNHSSAEPSWGFGGVGKEWGGSARLEVPDRAGGLIGVGGVPLGGGLTQAGSSPPPSWQLLSTSASPPGPENKAEIRQLLHDQKCCKAFLGTWAPQAPPRSPTASGVPGTPQPHPQGELLLLSGGHDWGVKGAPCCSRWAASILLPSPSFYPSILHPSPSLSTPSVRPTRVGAADSSAHAPPPPPTAGRCEGLHCRPGCASRQKRRRSAEVAEAQRAAATRSPPQPTAGTALTGGGPGGGYRVWDFGGLLG